MKRSVTILFLNIIVIYICNGCTWHPLQRGVCGTEIASLSQTLAEPDDLWTPLISTSINIGEKRTYTFLYHHKYVGGYGFTLIFPGLKFVECNSKDLEIPTMSIIIQKNGKAFLEREIDNSSRGSYIRSASGCGISFYAYDITKTPHRADEYKCILTIDEENLQMAQKYGMPKFELVKRPVGLINTQ